jgi:hypothetical protein
LIEIVVEVAEPRSPPRALSGIIARVGCGPAHFLKAHFEPPRATIKVASVIPEISRATREKTMKDAHNKAAEHHESAAKSHRAAADAHGKNEHSKGKEHSTTAQQQSEMARDQSKAAHSKSQQQS